MKHEQLPAVAVGNGAPADDLPIFDFRKLGLTKAMYTINGASDVLSIGRSRIYELIEDGELHPTWLGRKPFLFASDLAEFMCKLKKNNTPPPSCRASGRGSNALRP